MSGPGLRRIRETLAGYVVVGVRGKNPERLVNLCLSNGFPVWDFVRRGDDGEGGVAGDRAGGVAASGAGGVAAGAADGGANVRARDGADASASQRTGGGTGDREGQYQAIFTTTLAKYREIRPLARKARCVPRVIKRVGLPFFIGKVRRRPSLFWAAVLLFALLTYLSGSVWAIRVEGVENIDPEDVMRAAENAGLVTGARRSRVSAVDVETAILRDIPQLAWVYVHYQGTLAEIQVVEKTRPEMEEPGDIVADKDGVIDKILVLSGVPKVVPGQTVQKGDVLIEGNAETGRGARGTVTALTFYEGYQELSLRRVLPMRTGNKVEAKVVRYAGNEFTMLGKKDAFQWYEVEDYPLWKVGRHGSKGVNLEVFTRVYFEITWTEQVLTYEEAKGMAERQATDSVQRRLPSSAKLIDLTCEALPTDGETVYIRAVASSIEDIGTVRPWPEKDAEVSN